MTHSGKLGHFRVPSVFVKNFDCTVFSVIYLSVNEKKFPFTVSQINEHLENSIGSKTVFYTQKFLILSPTKVPHTQSIPYVQKIFVLSLGYFEKLNLVRI